MVMIDDVRAAFDRLPRRAAITEARIEGFITILAQPSLTAGASRRASGPQPTPLTAKAARDRARAAKMPLKPRRGGQTDNAAWAITEYAAWMFTEITGLRPTRVSRSVPAATARVSRTQIAAGLWHNFLQAIFDAHGMAAKATDRLPMRRKIRSR
jgi:hypothetical protein